MTEEGPLGIIVDGLFVPNHAMFGYKNIGDVWKKAARKMLDEKINELQQQMESAECYIRGKLDEHLGESDGGLFLVCEREECELGDYGFEMPFQQQLPDNCLPEYAVMMRAKHLATHADVITIYDTTDPGPSIDEMRRDPEAVDKYLEKMRREHDWDGGHL